MRSALMKVSGTTEIEFSGQYQVIIQTSAQPTQLIKALDIQGFRATVSPQKTKPQNGCPALNRIFKRLIKG